MAINGLGSFDMMSMYNRINVSDQAISAVSPSKAENTSIQKPEDEKAKQQEPELKVNLNLESVRRRSGYNLEDISRDFTKREPFAMSRVDDQQMQSDMQKAVSDMEKDQSLMQYQYFVGDNNVILNNEDGIVIMK